MGPRIGNLQRLGEDSVMGPVARPVHHLDRTFALVGEDGNGLRCRPERKGEDGSKNQEFLQCTHNLELL